MKTKNTQKTRTMVTMAILIALVAVLQTLSILIGQLNPIVSFTLALVPIVIGAILYGKWAGAFLGAVMGIIVFISVLTYQAGPLSAAMLEFNPVITGILCVLKTALAGFVSGIAYKAISKSGKDRLAIIVSAILCPMINTGIFLAGLLTVFYDIAAGFAGGNMLYFVLVLILGINFVVEFILNSVLAPVIYRIMMGIRKNKLAQ